MNHVNPMLWSRYVRTDGYSWLSVWKKSPVIFFKHWNSIPFCDKTGAYFLYSSALQSLHPTIYTFLHEFCGYVLWCGFMDQRNNMILQLQAWSDTSFGNVIRNLKKQKIKNFHPIIALPMKYEIQLFSTNF